jgi:hypothetical protein
MGQIYNSDSIALSGTGSEAPTTFEVGDVESLPAGSEPTVSFDEGADGVQVVSFGIPEGQPGVDGEPGPANMLTVGEVATLPAGEPASAEITGEAPGQTLNLSIPQGPAGGPPNTLTIGTVKTLPAGEEATVEITGDAPNQTINFGIPQGNDGAIGLPLAGEPGSTALMQVINGDNTVAPGGGIAGSRLVYAGLLVDGSVMTASNTVAGTWKVWGVLASTEQSATTVTLMARTDGTTLLTPTAMLESARMSANVRNCQYNYPGITAALDCEILVNGQWHPFTAMTSDHTSYGPIIYRNAKAGMYGEIKPYQKTE